MTLEDRIRARFGIGATCASCTHKHRDCYTQNINMNELCDLMRTHDIISTIPKDQIPNLDHDQVLWYDDGLWRQPYPVSIESVDETTIEFSNGESDDMDTYGKYWLLWTGKPPIEAKLKRG